MVLYSGCEKSWKFWKIALDNFDVALYNDNPWYVGEENRASMVHTLHLEN